MSKVDEKIIKDILGLAKLTSTGQGGRGCISSGTAYETDKFGCIFIKFNSKSGAKVMFDGEYASLEAIYNTQIVRSPKPIKVIEMPRGGAVLVMEYINMKKGLDKYSSQLGEQLARLHLHNEMLKKNGSSDYVSQFGFPTSTCCGYIEMNNDWCRDWPTYYAKKIELQLNLLEQKGTGKKARELWSQLLPIYPKFFEGIEITPALLHGDLWSGNTCEDDSGPIIFDPASFYGHSEFDLGITYLFGGFDSRFYKSYHKLIPKAQGFEKRKELYKLFHYINHWNHFGGGYEGSTISTLQRCLQLF